MTLYGIDVSRWQGPINWEKVYTAGVRFVTVKASAGTELVTDDATKTHFLTEFPKARVAGLVVGAYHVIRSVSVTAQIDWFMRRLDSVGADPANVIIQWDYELWRKADGTILDFPTYTTLKACIEEFARRTGKRGILYTGKWVWDRLSSKPANAKDDLGVPLWDSNYGGSSDPMGSNPTGYYTDVYPGDQSARWTRSYGGWTPTILQYGSRTTVPGVSTYCDADAFRGDLATFRSIFAGGPVFSDLDLY